MATANLSSLPKEILLVIFNLSDSQQDVRHLSKVCRRLRDVYSSGGRRLLERVVKNQDSGWLDMVLGMGFMYRVSPSVHAYWFAYLKFDYDTLTPRLHRRTIRDLLYGKHGDKFESALHDFLNQFDNVHSKCGDILSADACRVLELGARYQRDLFKALKMKPSSLAESTMLVALALRCLAISLDLGRFVIKGENVPEHGHFVVHKGGLTSGAAQGMAVWPKIEYSTDPTDFLPEDRQIQLFKGDKRDDYSTMMLYLVQMISMQIRENNPRTWLSTILALCILSPIYHFFRGWEQGPYDSSEQWGPHGKGAENRLSHTRRRVFR
ncbi:hypothetical protein BJY04DRAFT_215803 [Aspergillus karnatakaensis]|uniref:uncharacterized protein n=1 Tax=Aspergillus karnatakaensis TaxID=1810916 RepID=UPI003CCCD408